MTSTETREIPDIDEDLCESPACGFYIGHCEQMMLWTKIPLPFRRNFTMEKCPNTAEWVGAARCCGQTMLACASCRDFSLRKARLHCARCKRTKKPPRWMPI